MAALLLLLLVISHATEKGHCSLPPLTWFKDHRLNDRIPNIVPIAIRAANDATACATLCSDEVSCSAFFYKPKAMVCHLHDTVFVNSVKMVNSPGYLYYRIMSDGCPVNRCYYLLRDGDETLCVIFFRNARNDYLNNRQMCETHEGRLPILDTRKKTEMVVRLLDSNTDYPEIPSGIFLGAKKPIGGEFVWNNNQPVPSASSPESFWFKINLQVPQSGGCIYLSLPSQTTQWGWLQRNCSRKAADLLCELKPNRGP